jgi:hypothetical protein
MQGNIPKVAVVMVAAGLLTFSVPAAAHHSFAAIYELGKEIEFEGKIAEVTLRSPHSFLFVEAKDESGAIQKWAVEGPSAAQFVQQGVDPATFKAGDIVQIVGNPGRNKIGYRARLVKIVRPSDGKSWGTRAGEVVN